MSKSITGRVWALGENIDTDVLYPGKYLPIIDPVEMAKHAMEGIDPAFPQKLRAGDIIVAGPGFGIGSSREQAATCLKFAGVTAIVAPSVARIFYRNAVNQGLYLVQADITAFVKSGDEITIDFENCIIRHPGGETGSPAA
jgi:3-isopropylmalate/(R)-2-methylmalate dehydratase small subunit